VKWRSVAPYGLASFVADGYLSERDDAGSGLKLTIKAGRDAGT